MRAGSRQLKLFCAVYSLSPDTKLLDMIDEVLAFMGDEAKMCEVVGATAAAKLKQEGHLAHWQCERASYQRQCVNLEASLYAD